MSKRKPGPFLRQRRPGTTDETLKDLRDCLEDEPDILFAYAYSPRTDGPAQPHQVALWFDPPPEVQDDDQYIEQRILALRERLAACNLALHDVIPLNNVSADQRSTILCCGTLLFSKDEGVRRRLYINNNRAKPWTPWASLHHVLGIRRLQRTRGANPESPGRSTP